MLYFQNSLIIFINHLYFIQKADDNLISGHKFLAYFKLSGIEQFISLYKNHPQF